MATARACPNDCHTGASQPTAGQTLVAAMYSSSRTSADVTRTAPAGKRYFAHQVRHACRDTSTGGCRRCSAWCSRCGDERIVTPRNGIECVGSLHQPSGTPLMLRIPIRCECRHVDIKTLHNGPHNGIKRLGTLHEQSEAPLMLSISMRCLCGHVKI